MPQPGHRPFLNDPRDRPYLGRMVQSGSWAVASLIFLYGPAPHRLWVSVLYLALTMGLFFPPFTLMLHFSSHRLPFSKRVAWMNEIIPAILSPFFGHTPWTYGAHHLGMHHVEENLWKDASSTLPYRRDSLIDFGRYLFRFLIFGMVDLSIYLWRHRRKRLFRRALIGEVGFWMAVVILLRVNAFATLTIFVLPTLLARVAMMCGNWAQHAFVDPGSPENAYRNSVTCIDIAYNRRCFNDGYHIGHHLYPKMHWTELPNEYESNLERYRREGALVFSGIDTFAIWAFLMVGAYRRLARHLVCPLGSGSSIEDRVVLLKGRLHPVPVHGALESSSATADKWGRSGAEFSRLLQAFEPEPPRSFRS